MSIQNAINFLSNAGKNEVLRSSLIPLKKEEILPALAEQGYAFTIDEMEDCINMLHVKCQTQEQADYLFELVGWFKMLYV